MKTRNITTVLVCAALLGVAALPGHAQEKAVRDFKAAGKRPGFTSSGIITAVLTGTVLIGGESVEITSQTRIYQIGVGMLEEGALVESSSVLASGDRFGDKRYANIVIVSPRQSGRDFSQSTLTNVLLPANAPR